MMGDWLISYGQSPIRDAAHLVALTSGTTADERILLTLRRDGTLMTITVPGGKLGIAIY